MLPAAATWTVRGVGTVLFEGAGVGAGGALLIAGAAGVALQQPVRISREQAEHIGSVERAERAKLVADAHGRPVALPTPSPFVDEKFVQSLPTQAEIEQHHGEIPHPLPGSAPRPADEYAMESRRYPFVDSNHLAEGVKALGDTGRCFPDFHSFSGDSRAATQQLSKLMQPPPGWETHHLVEQSRTAQFGTQAIQNTANAINLPEEIHRAVSAAYSRTPERGTPAYDYKIAHPEAKINTVRDFVKTLPFEQQRQFSIERIQKTRSSNSMSTTATAPQSRERSRNSKIQHCARRISAKRKPRPSRKCRMALSDSEPTELTCLMYETCSLGTVRRDMGRLLKWQTGLSHSIPGVATISFLM